MPWVKKKRRRKWYRKTDLKAYLVIILSCIVVAAALSFLVEQAPVFIDELEESVIQEMARQSDMAGTPGPAGKNGQSPLDRIDPADRRKLEALKKTYSETGKLDDQDREDLEELKRRYSNAVDSEDRERLMKQYRVSQESNPDQ